MIYFLSENEDHSLLVNASKKDEAVTIGPDRLAQVREKAIYVQWSDGAHGGAVVIETAHSVGHRGPWALVKRLEWSAPGKEDYVSLPGAHLALRVRLESDIVTGSVSVYGIGN